MSLPPKHLRRCKVKPHGSLVPVSSTHRCAYTPGLSTSSSSTFLQDSQGVRENSSRASFVLRCFQHLSLPHLATGQCHWHDNPNTSDASTPVLSYWEQPLSSPAPTADRDRTVSRRSKPSSRTTLNGEQPYPWDLLQPQDVMSRHRGAKHRRRYELLGGISLLSPGTFYPLSDGLPFRTTGSL